MTKPTLKRLRRPLAATGVALACVMLLGQTTANATGGRRHDDTACFPVLGTIRVSMATTNCTSPVGFCTTGTFRSGYISGTTSYRATGLGGAPVGEASIVTPPSEPATTWSYAGDLTITTRIGTVVFHDVGVVDTAAGTFTEIDRPTSGTGALEGVTGRLFMSGDVTGGGTGFEGQVTGRLCVPID